MLARALVIGFGIAIVFPLLVYHGVTTVYPAPKREDFFPQFEPQLSPTATPEERQARAEIQKKRQDAFNEVARRFSRVLLVAATGLGVPAILLGSFITSPAIGAGLMLGGVLAVGVGYWWYSSLINDWWRFGSLLIGFATLLFVGYRQHRNQAT